VTLAHAKDAVFGYEYKSYSTIGLEAVTHLHDENNRRRTPEHGLRTQEYLNTLVPVIAIEYQFSLVHKYQEITVRR
jgi:hypothetical protein